MKPEKLREALRTRSGLNARPSVAPEMQPGICGWLWYKSRLEIMAASLRAEQVPLKSRVDRTAGELAVWILGPSGQWRSPDRLECS